MSTWLTRLAGVPDDPRPQRALTPGAKAVIDEVRLAALKADGVLRLTDRIMEGVVEMDDDRRHLARGDETKNLILAELEATAVQKLRGIQRQLYSQIEDV